MKLDAAKIYLSAIAIIFFFATAINRAQQNPLGSVKNLQAADFTSDQYFEPPNQQQVKMRLSGASASPLPNGAQDIRDLKIETFDVGGKPEMIIHAAQCTYALLDGVASSPGHLEMQTADGKMRIEGDGFLWRQTDNSLTISNNVRTMIESGILKLNAP